MRKLNFIKRFSERGKIGKPLTRLQKIIYWGIITLLLILSYLYNITALIVLIVWLVFHIFKALSNLKAHKYITGNGIVFGGRGKGKGLILQFKMLREKKAFCNVPYGENVSTDFTFDEYFNSIKPNTMQDIIKNEIKLVNKLDKYEGINIYADDMTVYTPNIMDNEIKKLYPSAPPMLAVNRHLYNHYFMLTVQDPERPVKFIKELQTDFSVKALQTIGWGKLWSSIPVLRKYVLVKYRYYEEIKARDNGVLPFNAKAILNETMKHGYLTSGQAQKEQFIAQNGKVFHGYIFIRKDKITYDTRHFHEKFFGEKSPTTKGQ